MRRERRGGDEERGGTGMRRERRDRMRRERRGGDEERGETG